MSWSVAVVLCVGMLCASVIVVSIIDCISEKNKDKEIEKC